MPRKYRLQAVSALFALAVLGCEQGVTDVVGPPTKDIASSPAAVPFSGTAEIVSAVTVTAAPTFSRAWSWTIDKTVDPTSTTISAGESVSLAYAVDLDAASVDSDWAVSGDISFVVLPPASITDITVSVGGTPVVPTCSTPVFTPGGPPFLVLPPSPPVLFTCSYAASLGSGSPLSVDVVVVDGFGPPGLGSVGVDFDVATTEVDACVDVTDSETGSLGTSCAADPLSQVFGYGVTMGPFVECGDHVIDNTASFAAPAPSTASGSATASER